MIVYQDEDGCVEYIDRFLSVEHEQKVQQQLMQELLWQQETIKVFAREYPQPRLTAWIGRGLSAASRYSKDIPATPWWDDLERIRLELCNRYKTEFNSALANLYRSGSDGMGMHADDEPILGADPTIASLSFGATRRFICHHRKDPAKKLRVDLAGGSLLVMSGGFQHFWKHGVPKTKKSVDPRINLTFRELKS